LPIKLNTEDPKVLTLSVSGSRDVTAADITPDADVEILQPDYHIATLTAKSARLSMEIGVEKGRGYVTADRQKNVEHMIGLIPMDSIFSPIRKVNFAVDDTRVGQSVDFDRLSVEVETNGSITPDDALAQAALILQEQLDIFTGFNAEEKTPTSAPTSEWDIPVETLNLSVRSFNCLKRAGISKVSELLDMSEDEIIKMRNFGKKSLDEIKQVLSERGLALRGALCLPTMPHQIAKKRLSRPDGARKALLRSLATSFFKHEKIETTTTKAKEITKVIDRLITTARRGDLHSRRQVASYLLEPAVTKKLCDQIAPALKERTGGFTRITKTRVRPGDAAELSIVELVH